MWGPGLQVRPHQRRAVPHPDHRRRRRLRRQPRQPDHVGRDGRSRANIVIRKVSVGGDATFGYTATGGIASPFTIATSGGQGSTSFTGISHGTYSVTEDLPGAPWSFTSLVCDDPDSGTTVASRTATIDLDPGETVTCTYTNTKAATVIVKKVWSAVLDRSPTPGRRGSISSTTGRSRPTSPPVSTLRPRRRHRAGICLDLLRRRQLDGLRGTPATFNVAAGETVTCTFTNRKQGTVIVKKVMVGGPIRSRSRDAGGSIHQQRDDLRESRPGTTRRSRVRRRAGSSRRSSATTRTRPAASATRTANFNVDRGRDRDLHLHEHEAGAP